MRSWNANSVVFSILVHFFIIRTHSERDVSASWAACMGPPLFRGVLARSEHNESATFARQKFYQIEYEREVSASNSLCNPYILPIYLYNRTI